MKWKSLKHVHRLEYLPGHSWTIISLQLEGVQWGSEGAEKVIERRLKQIEQTNEYEVIGINISKGKAKVHLLAKDIRKRTISFKIKTMTSQRALSEQDIINILTKAGCYDIELIDYESQIMSHSL